MKDFKPSPINHRKGSVVGQLGNITEKKCCGI